MGSSPVSWPWRMPAVITLLDIAFTALGVGAGSVVSAFILALVVVLLLNPIYGRTQKVVDRVFFRERRDIQRSLESLSDSMTTMRDLDGIGTLILGAIDDFFHPVRLRLLVLDPERGVYQGIGAGEAFAATDPARRLRARPLSRARARVRHAGAARGEPGARRAPRGRAGRSGRARGQPRPADSLPRKRHGHLRAGGQAVGGGVLDLRPARAPPRSPIRARSRSRTPAPTRRSAGRAARALRRVEILESIRANLSKFVPRVVQRLIEAAPESPALAKREVDVSVLFVDIVGYSRLADRLDAARLNELVERYFGAFLDEILAQGGDVNETAGDGLMVIFQDDGSAPSRGRGHPRRARRARRTAEINAAMDADHGPPAEPIGVHVGVNSGVAAVGATKIEGMAGTRWTYTASGSVTNVAARLAALGAGGAC